MGKKKSHTSSDDWQTPGYIYKPLDAEFHFDFDPCPLNHDVGKWDGLKVSWGKRTFCNPPYTFRLKERFVLKAIAEARLGKLVVMLLPVSTSTTLFHDIILENTSEPVRFIKRRIRFIGHKYNGELTAKGSPMHDSMIVIFGTSDEITRQSMAVQKKLFA